MTEPTCRCGQPTAGTILCRGCSKTLDVAIANIRAYYTDLDTIRTRQTRYTAVAGKTSVGREQALPVDLRFTDSYGTERDPDGHLQQWGTGTELAWVTRNTIVGWTRIVLQHYRPLGRPIICGDPLCRRCQPLAAETHLRRPPGDNLISCCHYLQRLLPRLVAAGWSAEMLDELLDLERQLARFVDRPPDLTYVGPCTAGLSGLAGAWICGADLYAAPGNPEVTCRACNATYRTEQRHAWVLSQAEDEWNTAPTIAAALVVYSDDVSGDERRLAARVRQWAARGRLTERDRVCVKGQQVPRYRVGDVLDLVYETPRRAEGEAG